MSNGRAASPTKHRVSTLFRLINLERGSPMRRSTFQSQRFHPPPGLHLGLLADLITYYSYSHFVPGSTRATDRGNMSLPRTRSCHDRVGEKYEAIVRNDPRRNVVSREELNHMEIESSAEPVFVADLSALTVMLLQNLYSENEMLELGALKGSCLRA